MDENTSYLIIDLMVDGGFIKIKTFVSIILVLQYGITKYQENNINNKHKRKQIIIYQIMIIIITDVTSILQCEYIQSQQYNSGQLSINIIGDCWIY
eukprot:195370_1